MVSPTSSTSSTHTHVERDVHTDLVAQDGSQNGVQLETQKVDDQDVLATLPEPKTVDGAALNRPPTRVYIKDHGPCTEIPPAQSPTLNLDSPVGQTPSPHAISPTQTTQATQTTHIAQSTPPARPFPPVIRQTTASSTRPYSAFPNHTKWLIVVLSGIAGIFSPISSNIFVPAIPALSTAFNRSQQDISLAVTIYLVFQAVTPSFFGSMSDSFGRRPVYLGTLTVYMGANVGLALCPTDAYWLLLVLRALQVGQGYIFLIHINHTHPVPPNIHHGTPCPFSVQLTLTVDRRLSSHFNRRRMYIRHCRTPRTRQVLRDFSTWCYGRTSLWTIARWCTRSDAGVEIDILVLDHFHGGCSCACHIVSRSNVQIAAISFYLVIFSLSV